MVKSMTGYGRSQQIADGMNITVEIKSVNHKYFEFNARVPRTFGFLEEKLKSFTQSLVSRGKIECFVSIEMPENENVEVSVNYALAEGYINALKALCEKYSLREDVSVTSISRYPDVLTVHKLPEDEEKIWQAVKTVASEAIDSFISMREKEGEKLCSDILSRADAIIECVEFIEKRSPQTVTEYNEKLKNRIRELIGDVSVDEQRLLQEAAIYADKIAVAEETVRLRSHISQLREMFDSTDAVGRKMDFLVQEINREANTIGSKAQDVEITRRVLTIKGEVEKIREQVQNIE